MHQGATYLDARVAQTVINQLKPVTKEAKPTQNIPPGTLSAREMEVLRLIVDCFCKIYQNSI